MQPAQKLPRRSLGVVRLCARRCLIEANGDREEAIKLVHARMESVVGSALLSVAIQLAIKFIIWWIENRVTEPSVVLQYGEPCSEDDGEDDQWDES